MFGVAAVGQAGPEAGPEVSELAHVSNKFRFEIGASMARVAPVFGPDGERGWAGKHWDPVFQYPQPGRDVEGAVFTVRHGEHDSVWVNTIFDLKGGRFQYVAVIPEALASVIDVRLTAVSDARTAVEVSYVRTALTAETSDDVREMGKKDRESGAEWKAAIETCLGLAGK